jgi:hypothetical protein
MFLSPILLHLDRSLTRSRLHPNEALRTILAILPLSPHLAFKASELFPEGYYLEIICIEDGSRFFACHVSPKYLTYYANTGFETLDLVAYYQRHNLPEEINLKFHEKTIPELFYSFPGRRAEYLSRLAENKVFTINRYPYDPCIYELPKDWKAEFKTPWHIEHKIPSNIPNSPEGDYFFEYLQWKLRVGKPVSRKFSSFFCLQTNSSI